MSDAFSTIAFLASHMAIYFVCTIGIATMNIQKTTQIQLRRQTVANHGC